MAHDIFDNDEFFSVREPAWHGLGHVLDDYPTREEAQALVHPWEPIEEPIYLKDVVIEEVEPHGYFAGIGASPTPYLEPRTVFNETPEFKAIRRSDDASLLGVVGGGYEIVTNNELWDIAEALEQDNSDVMFETAGSLEGGKKVWILIRLKEPLDIPGDPNGATLPYFTLQNAHDGSKAFRGSSTLVRIVCANTAQAADLDAKQRGTQFTFRHTANIRDRIEEAQQALTGWRYSVEQFVQMSAQMIGMEVTDDQRNAFVERWLGKPDPALVTERVMDNYERAEQDWFSFYYSPTCEGITGTASGLLQASIEYAEWGKRAHTSESRFKRSYLDRNQLVQSAQKMALEAVAG